MGTIRTDAERLTSVATEVAASAGSQRARPVEATRKVRIERLILHGLDNRDEQPRLVDEPALLSEEIEAFFAQHLVAAAGRADWRASFHEPEGEVARLCAALLGSHETFVQASQRLARRLFEQMRPRTIAPGDFVAIVYTNGDEACRRIALLKLDPDRRLAREFTTVGRRTRVSISASGNLLPDTARLQKCALLEIAADGTAFEMTLLDTQAGPRTDGVAAFFYRGFLEADLAPSPRRRTRDFLRSTDTWLAGHRTLLSPAEQNAFYEARRAALGNETLDIVLFAEAAVPTHPALRLELCERVAAALGIGQEAESPFTVDAAVAGPVVSRVVLELDGGARLIVPAERFAELVRIEPARTSENKIRIVIESLTLKEVSER